MNSKQRRRENRRQATLIHTIELARREDDDNWIRFDDRTIDAHKWCKDTLKRDIWAVEHHFSRSVYRFKNESDLTLFILRWA